MTTPALEVFNLADITSAVQIPAGTCLLAYRGSIAHGMYVKPTDPKGIDDVDLMGCVLGAPENYFGLREWGSRGTKEIKQDRWDCVFYEIRKLVSLLLQGNPNVLSLLWCQPGHYLYRDAAGQALIDNRHLFVGRHVYNAFAGYAHAQLEKMETRDPAELREYLAVTQELKHRGVHPNPEGKFCPPPQRIGIGKDVEQWDTIKLKARLRHFQKKGENIGYMGDKRKQLVLEHGYDSKNAAHLIRLLRMCREFMETGELTVFRPDADELLEIKRGEWPLEKVKAQADLAFEECRRARDASSLRDEPDRQGAEALLVNLLRKHVGCTLESDSRVEQAGSSLGS